MHEISKNKMVAMAVIAHEVYNYVSIISVFEVHRLKLQLMNFK